MTTKTLVLVRFHANLHYADLNGLFVTTASRLQQIIDEQPRVYLGEVCGKHSEVELRLTPSNIQVISDDINFIKSFQSKFDVVTESIGEECHIFGTNIIDPLEENEFFAAEEE